MVILLINWIFNGFLFSLTLLCAFVLIGKHFNSYYDYFLLGYLTETLFLFIGISQLGQYFFGLFCGGRAAIGREQQKIKPLLDEVLERANSAKATNYQASKIRLLIMDIKKSNSQAIGSNTIILTDGLLRTTTNDELRAILAHEVGMLYYKGGLVLMAMLASGFASRIVMWFYTIYLLCAQLFTMFGNKSRHNLLKVGSIFTLIPLVIFLPVIVLNWCANKISKLSILFIKRQYAYQADKFAKELGYQEGLIGFLDKEQLISEHDNSIIGRILVVSPAPMSRIAKLEGETV